MNFAMALLRRHTRSLSLSEYAHTVHALLAFAACVRYLVDIAQDNADKLDIPGADRKKMVEYRAQLDAERDKALAKGKSKPKRKVGSRARTLPFRELLDAIQACLPYLADPAAGQSFSLLPEASSATQHRDARAIPGFPGESFSCCLFVRNTHQPRRGDKWISMGLVGLSVRSDNRTILGIHVEGQPYLGSA